MSAKKSIPFVTDDGQEVDFVILEQTTVNGCSYLLVEEAEDGSEDVVYIMKENPDASDDERNAYVIVEEETELLLVSKIFEQLMDDTDIVLEGGHS